MVGRQESWGTLESKCDELSDGKCSVTFPLEIKDVVYDKTTGIMIGFYNHGGINDLMRRERGESSHPPVAKYVLALMVRVLFFKFDFPLAHFSTGVTGHQLYPIAWEGIQIIERTGLKVIVVTAD